MDANLFGSFSRSQSQKRRQSSSRKSSLPSKPALESGINQKETMTEPKGVVDSGKDKMASTLKDSDRTSEAKSILKTPEKPKSIKTLSELVLKLCLTVEYVLVICMGGVDKSDTHNDLNFSMVHVRLS